MDIDPTPSNPNVNPILVQNVPPTNIQTQPTQPNLVNPIQINSIPPSQPQQQTGLVFNPVYNHPPTQQPLVYGQQFPQAYGQPQTFNQPFSPYGQNYPPQSYGQVFTPPNQSYGNYQQQYTQPYSQPFNQPYQNFQAPQSNITLSQPTYTNPPKSAITLETKKTTL